MLKLLKLALRSLIARPARTLLTTFGIVLGVAVILAISITNLSTIDSISNVFSEASGKAHLVITSSDANSEGFDQEIARRIAGSEGVKSAVPVLRAQTMLADEVPAATVEVSFFGAVQGGLSIYGIDPLVDREAREYKIVEGRFLDTDQSAHDIVLVKDYSEAQGLQVGQSVDILTPEGIESLRIVGLISKEGPGQLNNGAFGAMPIETAQKLFGRSGKLDQIDVVAQPGHATGDKLAQLKLDLQQRLGEEYAVIYPATQGERVTQMLAVYQLGLDFFAVIAIFVGAFLIYNAFSMTVVERTREIGMLRTIGMTRRQVMSQILTEATFLGLVGAILGVGAGILLAQGLIRGMELILAQEVRDVRIPLDGLATGVVIGIGVTLAAATIPALQASRISPLEALRVRGVTREGWLIRKGWPIGLALLVMSYFALFQSRFLPPMVQLHLGRFAVFTLFLGASLVIPATISYWERAARPFLQRIYGSEGRLGSSNIQRAKLRTALTVAALMVGAAMILGIRGMTNAFERDIQSWIDVYVGGDLYVFGSLPMRVDLAKRLEAVEGVASVAPMRYVDIRRIDEGGNKENLVYTAIDPTSYSRVTSFVFASNQGNANDLLNRLAEGDAVFISSVLSEKHGLQQGDTIRLETRRGQRDFKIAAVVVDFYNQGQVVEGSWKDLRRYFGLNDVSAFLLEVQSGYEPEGVKARIDELYGKSRHLTVESNRAMKERALTITAQAFSLFDVLALIAMIVAALGVVNTLTMSVLERTREIGMLRSLGMTRRQVGKMILAEAVMMGLIGGVFGIVFGLFLLRVILMATNSIQGYELTYNVPTQAVIISLIIALVVSQLAALWPARRAARIRILDAIQFE